MKRPLLGASLLFATGILLGWWGRPSFPLCLFIAALLVVLFLLSHRWAVSRWILFAFVAATGMTAFAFSTSYPSPNHLLNLLPGEKGQNVAVTGVIVSEPRYQSFETDVMPLQSAITQSTIQEPDEIFTATDRVDFLLDVKAIRLIDKWQPAEGRVMVYVRTNQAENLYRYGQVVRCEGILSKPRVARNPGQFDFRSYLAARKTFFLLRVREDDQAIIEEHDHGIWLVSLALRVRDRLSDVLHIGLYAADSPTPLEAQVGGLLSGMLLGYREKIPDDVRLSFTRTGAMHIFAISGLHVGMIATILIITLRLAHVPRRWCAAAAIPMLFFYVLATGMRPSALRAFIMAAVFISCWLWVRPSDALNSLGAAALVILMIDPQQLFDGGCQMSFAVVASIILGMPPLENIFVRHLQPDPFLPTDLIPQWKRNFLAIARLIAQWVALSLAAWLGSLPFMAYYFNIFSPIAILGNMVVVALAFVIVATGFLAIVTSMISTALAATLNAANFFFGATIIKFTDWLSDVPWGYRYVEAPPWWLIVLYFVAFTLLLSSGALRRGWQRKFSFLGIVVLTVTGLWAWMPNRQTLQIIFLDVESGSSVFLRGARHRDDVLIDGGREKSGRYILEPFLRSRGVDMLPRVIATQRDVAHAGGLTWLFGRIPIAAVLDSGWRSVRSPIHDIFLQKLDECRIPLKRLRKGDTITLNNRTFIRVLHPPAETPFKSMSDNALVLQVRHGNHRVLLMSNVGAKVEQMLLETADDLESQFLFREPQRQEMVCTAAFLDRVKPHTIIIARGGFGGSVALPPDAMDRINERNITIYDTARHGAVTLELQDDDWKIKTILSPR